LEGMSLNPGPEIYRRVKAAHGDHACNFIRIHVTEDQDHMKKAEAALRPLSDEQLKLVEWSLCQTQVIYEAIMRECLTAAAKKQKAA